jgi:glycosyltransferase involved in cell wall biosynthesis
MLQEAVRSVLCQTYRPIEVIVVDDGSTDGTAIVADTLAQAHPEVRVVHQPNAGVGRAREAGRRAANGEFIQHLDSDDLLEPTKFARQVAGLRERPHCGASYGWTRMRFRDGSAHSTPWKRTGQRMETILPAMLQSRWWETNTALYRASVLERAGPWMPLRCEEDWEYDCRIGALGVSLHFVEDWVSEYRQHATHLSGHSDRGTLKDRAVAHAAILVHARTFGIGDTAPEMQHFRRELFLLARQCGAVGLVDESAELFGLARSVGGGGRGQVQFRIYELLSRRLGWQTMGRLSAMLDKLRP